MSQEIHYLETGSQDPFYNLAFEETVLRSRRSGEYLLLWHCLLYTSPSPRD